MPNLYGSDLPTLPLEFLVWLATGSAHQAIFGARWLYGIARFCHIAGAGGFFGVVLIVETRLIGLFPSASLESMRSPLVKLLHWSFGITIVSGAVLLVYDPVGAGLHSMFLVKLLLVLFGLIHAHGIRQMLTGRGVALRRIGATVALLTWTLVMGAAVWNRVERPVDIGGAMRLRGIGHE